MPCLLDSHFPMVVVPQEEPGTGSSSASGQGTRPRGTQYFQVHDLVTAFGGHNTMLCVTVPSIDEVILGMVHAIIMVNFGLLHESCVGFWHVWLAFPFDPQHTQHSLLDHPYFQASV